MVRGNVQHGRGGVLLLLVLLVASPAVRAVEFAGGTGTADDPYQIATAEQLISIGADPNLFSRCYAMVNDIDLNPSLSPQHVFHRPVIDGRFSGIFDGRGFCIRHFTLEEESGDGNRAGGGVFGTITRSGQVRGLILEEVRVFAGVYWNSVGALCNSNDGLISRCSVTGIVLGGNIAAPIVARNGYGTIRECHGACTVFAPSSSGLVGINGGTIENCYASGHVLGVAGGVTGGLVAEAGGSIKHCYATCEVENTGSDSGGLVGGGVLFRPRGNRQLLPGLARGRRAEQRYRHATNQCPNEGGG
jgi:hypothetical protein